MRQTAEIGQHLCLIRFSLCWCGLLLWGNAASTIPSVHVSGKWIDIVPFHCLSGQNTLQTSMSKPTFHSKGLRLRRFALRQAKYLVPPAETTTQIAVQTHCLRPPNKSVVYFPFPTTNRYGMAPKPNQSTYPNVQDSLTRTPMYVHPEIAMMVLTNS